MEMDYTVNISVDMTGEIQSFEKIEAKDMDWTKWILGVQEDVPIETSSKNDEFIIEQNGLDELFFEDLMPVMQDAPLTNTSEIENLIFGSSDVAEFNFDDLLTSMEDSPIKNTTNKDDFFIDDLKEFDFIDLMPLMEEHQIEAISFDLKAEIYDKSKKVREQMNSIGNKMKRGPYKKQVRPAKIFDCKMCPVTCKSNYALNLHVNVVHKKEKQHKCKTCGKGFGRIGHLRAHEVNHLIVEKNFECETCHYKFKTLASLKTHQITHKPSNFICDICHKGYKTNYHLKEHLNTHGSNTNYACSVCEKQFGTVTLLKMHLRSHVKTKLQCELCPTQLKSTQALKSHIMKYHSDIDQEVFRNQILKANNLVFDCETLEYVPKF